MNEQQWITGEEAARSIILSVVGNTFSDGTIDMEAALKHLNYIWEIKIKKINNGS